MTTDTLAELPDFLKPKLRLFMSVDITGSTQFKQILSHSPHKGGTAHKEESEEGVPSEPWLSPILEFYEQISAVFDDQWKAVAKHAQEEPHEWPVGDRPSVWKAVGDELIFTKILTDHRQAYLSVLAWLRTIQEYRQRIKRHSAGLDLKCAAWIAGFPVNNAEVVLDHEPSGRLASSDDGDYIFGNLARLCSTNGSQPPAGPDSERNITGIRDFIGPSIDTGFRVASVASPRKFVLAADLAFILSHVAGNLTTSWTLEKLVFYYEGRRDLKGVTNGTPYPIFWVNAVLPDPLMEIEDRIEKREPTAASEVKTFCERYLEKNKDTHVMKPFIFGDSDGLFKRIPHRHSEKLTKLASYWKQESARREAEQNAQLEPEGTAAPNEPAATASDLDALSSQLVLENTSPPAPQASEA
ncbi:hypothetical protein PQQ53_01605 [Paraburkholderia strydomiana]|uniref:hypothetical protein n=1 Tax=Paraburkholderia strydomiana TaxID=1245417 RepID=UPI0038BC5FB0